MPRRPRPASRAPPSSKRQREEDEEGFEREDRPRFSQWVPEDELDADVDSGSDPQDESDAGSESEEEAGLDESSQSSDSDSQSSDSDSEPEAQPSTSKPKPEWTTAKRKKDIGKRSSKHAPTEVTSKRPVSRHRQVIDVPTIAARDPRFMPLSGDLSEPHFSRSYSFITDLQRSEISSLRASLAKARKQRAPYETIDSLERALKRAESGVEKARRDEREREALAKVKKAEKEKREQGKGAWFMKKSEKREILLKAKFDDLAAQGGQNAVRKAIDKRKKKVAQKEKKARPFTKSQAKAFSQAGPSGSGGGPDRKRQRI